MKRNKIIAYKNLTTGAYILNKYFCGGDEDRYRQVTMREYLKHTSSEHIPNKNEAKKLRQIRSKHGLSESEVRGIKKYRKELSDAQKSEGYGRSRYADLYKHILKTILRDLKLPKEHPAVRARLKDELQDRYARSYNGHCWFYKPSVDSIIRSYKRKRK